MNLAQPSRWLRPARLRLPTGRRMLCAAIAGTILLIALTALLTLAYQRQQAEERISATTRNLARSLVHTFDGTIDGIDLSLLAAADEIARQRAGGRPERSEIEAFLQRQTQRLPAAPVLYATDAAGNIVHGGAGNAVPSAAERDFFTALSLRAGGALSTSRPILDQRSGKWLWLFARPIPAPGGRHDGNVMAVLEVDQIAKAMSRIELGAGGSIVLRSAQFEAIAARRGEPGGAALQPGDTRLLQELRASLAVNPARATYSTSGSVLSDRPHTFSYERSAKHGFYVWVGEAREAGLAEWYRQVWVVAALTLTFTLLASALLLLMLRAWQRQARDLEQIRRLAYYDSLTELPNRRLLLERLDAGMAGRAGRRCSGALLVVDLDQFKNLNDMHGHERGDLMLRQVAQRLRASVPPGVTLARLGGDEFAVLATALPRDAADARAQAGLIGDMLRQCLSGCFTLDGYQYCGSASIGIALFSGQAHSRDELVKRAETAMYQAKAAGRNAVRFFDPGMQAALAARLALVRDLRLALDAGQFALHYQVQVDAAGRARGAEALLRWSHPERGMVPPSAFIPLAEETGLIVTLGRWVLESACAQLARWARDAASAGLTLAVNVSACQFSQPGFVSQVLDVLAASGADPRRLKLELTEGLLIEHTDQVIATILALKRAGVGISLDDFGTGYSSLSYLKRLPLDQLKIDQAFVRDLLTDPTDGAIVRAIVTLGHSLGMDVIAEGVESAAQRDALAAAGCHTYQGYFFGKPMPIAQFDAALHRQQQQQAACAPAGN